MARTEVLPRPKASPRKTGNPVLPMARGAFPQGPRIKNFISDDEEIRYWTEQAQYWQYKDTAKYREARHHLVELAPRNQYWKPSKKEEQKKETTLDDIAKILLAIAGYGSLVPGPYGTAYKAVARAGRRTFRAAYQQPKQSVQRSGSGHTGNGRKPFKPKYKNRR